MARMLVKFRTCFGVNGSTIHPTRFIRLLRRLFFLLASSVHVATSQQLRKRGENTLPFP